MDVVLVFNDFEGKIRLTQPLGISYLASILRSSGIQVKLFNPSTYGDNIETSLNRLRNIHFKILGVSFTSDIYREKGYEFIKRIRERGFAGHISIGGHAPSLSFTKYLKECTLIDSVVVGEGEVTFVELVKAILYGDTNWQNVNGIICLFFRSILGSRNILTKDIKA